MLIFNYFKWIPFVFFRCSCSVYVVILLFLCFLKIIL
nr:MAG TPA: hypothetical protein [Caudoviricetes sp.]